MRGTRAVNSGRANPPAEPAEPAGARPQQVPQQKIVRRPRISGVAWFARRSRATTLHPGHESWLRRLGLRLAPANHGTPESAAPSALKAVAVSPLARDNPGHARDVGRQLGACVSTELYHFMANRPPFLGKPGLFCSSLLPWRGGHGFVVRL